MGTPQHTSIPHSYALPLLLAFVAQGTSINVLNQYDSNALSSSHGKDQISASLRRRGTATGASSVGLGGVFKYNMLEMRCLNVDVQKKVSDHLGGKASGRSPYFLSGESSVFTEFKTYKYANKSQAHWGVKFGRAPGGKSCLPWENPDWRHGFGCPIFSEKINSINS